MIVIPFPTTNMMKTRTLRMFTPDPFSFPGGHSSSAADAGCSTTGIQDKKSSTEEFSACDGDWLGTSWNCGGKTPHF